MRVLQVVAVLVVTEIQALITGLNSFNYMILYFTTLDLVRLVPAEGLTMPGLLVMAETVVCTVPAVVVAVVHATDSIQVPAEMAHKAQ